ncbi:hypothetical protein FisN_26Lh048 [Fistulifera solaris]|uniref:Uncharacterized protein n=1 Tax=Fistulifera solaris TaxID=1519565 RepID=A0A1Z5KCM8_FISSO|nr:hypothetical protein FisN_26Lh048 [Fistulifera solaris]|eukprot:GAX23987.1 hypothetical protein FisN_26Lh048 [Fistulifera solaris]
MIVEMRYLKVTLLALCCAFAWTVADPRPPKVLQLILSSPVGCPSDCHNTICLSVPSDGDPTIVLGAHSMFDYIFQCNFRDASCSLGTVYQIEGTGVMLEVSLLFGPSSSTGSIAVFEGCLSGASATDGSDSIKGIFPDCVRDHSNQGTRWMAKKGHFYSIVVYAQLGPSSKPFILRVNTAKSYPVCNTEEENTIAPVDLGTVNATSGRLRRLSKPKEIVLVSGLPSCDYEVPSFSVLYKITVSQPNVSVFFKVWGKFAYVTVYRGTCASGYSCLTIANSDSICEGPSGNKSTTASSDKAGEDGAFRDELDVWHEFSATFWKNNSIHRFHNEKAGTAYLISVNSCCGANVLDFELSVKASTYGNVCKDSSAVDMASGRFSVTVNHHDAKVYRDLNACFAMYYGHHSQQDSLQSSYVSIADPISSYVSIADPISSPARVYKITGDGETYVAYATHSSAPDPYTFLNYFFKMALFTVSEYEATPQCVQGYKYGRTISLETTAGETYYLAVYNDDGDSLETLELQLSFLSSKAPCEDATNLGIVGSSGRTISGTMDGANLYKGLEYGSLYEIIRAQAFAFVAEKDGPFMVSVKGSVTTPYNCSEIHYGLVRGECLHYTLLHVKVVLSCDVKAKLTNPGTPYFAASGVSYDVVVYSNHLFASEDFQLAIDFLETAEVCGSEHVVDMESIPNEGTVFFGTTEFAPLFVLPQSCQVHNSYASPVTRAAKFSLTGDGNAYVLFMGVYSSHFQMLVFTGSCEDLECMPQPETSRVLLETKLGETYTILVGDGTSNGEFMLHVNKTAAPVNVVANSMETALQLLAFICLFASVFDDIARYRIQALRFL